jgi:NAD-dependent SIR2 family protein deacetylase
MKDDIALKRVISSLGPISGYVICTGAGFSADSNIPVYAGVNGKWNNMVSPGLTTKEIQEFGTISGEAPLFLEKPQEFWNYFLDTAKIINDNKPHQGYYNLLEMVKDKPYYVVTSNIDGYHSRAGFKNVIECHGRLVNPNKTINVQCSEYGVCSCKNTWEWTSSKVSSDNDLLVCPVCKQIARPNYLSFNDHYCNIAPFSTENTTRKEMIEWLEKVKNDRIIIFEIGVGETVKTVKNRSRLIWQKYPNSILIRINPSPDPDGPEGLKERYINFCEKAIDIL